MSDQSARRRRELERQKEARQRRAHETQLSQAQAAARATLQEQHRHRMEAFILFGLAILVAVGHVFEHGGAIRLMSPGLQALLVGYPTAGILAVMGAIRFGT